MMSNSLPAWLRWLAPLYRSLGKAGPRPRLKAHPYRLGFELLEDRITPAYNVTIGTGATVNMISTQLGPHAVEWTPTASGANLNVTAIQQALASGTSVTISSSNTAGVTEAGNITWLAGANLNISGTGLNLATLTLETGADSFFQTFSVSGKLLSTTIGTIDLQSNITDSNTTSNVNQPDNLNIVIDTTATAGSGAAAPDISPATTTTGSTGSAGAPGIFMLQGSIETAGTVTVNGPTQVGGNQTIETNETTVTTTMSPTPIAIGADVTFSSTIDGLAGGPGGDGLTIIAGNNTTALPLNPNNVALPPSVVTFGTVGAGGNLASFSVSADVIDVSHDIRLSSGATGDTLSLAASKTLDITGPVTFGDTSTAGLTANLTATVPGSTIDVSGGILTISGNSLAVTVDGTFTLQSDLTVTSTTATGNSVTLEGGTTNFGANTIQLTNTDLDLKSDSQTVPVTGELTGKGTIALTSANLNVNSGGELATEVSGGQITVDLFSGAQVFFNTGGTFLVNLAFTDDLNVIGDTTTDVNLDGGTVTAVGATPSSVAVTLISVTNDNNPHGTILGTFANAPAGTPFALGSDAVTPSYNNVPGVSSTFQVTRAPLGRRSIAITQGANRATITLLGGGAYAGLVVTSDALTGLPDIVVENASAAWALYITLTAGTSVNVGSIGGYGTGAGTIVAPKVNVTGNIELTGPLTTLDIEDMIGSAANPLILSAGGSATTNTTIRGREFKDVNITLGSVLNLLTLNEYASDSRNTSDTPANHIPISTITAVRLNTARITASAGYAGDFDVNLVLGNASSTTRDAINSLTVGGTLSGIWDVFGPINSVKATHTRDFYIGWTPEATFILIYSNPAGSIATLNLGDVDTMIINANEGITTLDAVSLANATVHVKYVTTLRVTGTATAVSNSVFTIGGANAAGFGLQGVVIAGNVTGTTFTVSAGNVGAVSVARFIDSDLWVGYTPILNATFSDTASSGTFAASNFKVNSFTTTATSGAFAFDTSEVVAATLGLVTLTTVNNVTNGGIGVPFGLKVKKGAPASVGVVIRRTAPFNPGVEYRGSATGAVAPLLRASQGDFRFFVQ
jgi:hypothetical protein